MTLETILISHGICVTVDDKRRVYPDGAIYIEGNKIVDIGPVDQVHQRHPSADTKIDAQKHIVLPGLINSHCHSAECLERYLGADRDLLTWLTTSKWPFQGNLTPEDAYHEARLGLLENLRFGNTTIMENYYPPKTSKENVDSLLKVAQEYGLRYIMARGCHDNPENTPEIFCETSKETLQEYDRLYRTYHEKDNHMTKIAIAPVNLRNTTPEALSQFQEFAATHELLFHTHVSETQRDVEEVCAQYGKPYVEVFQDYNLLNHRLHGAHSIWVTPKEIELFAQSGAHVIYCPTSNMYVGLGICPIPDHQAAGTNIAIGTDTQSVTGNLDLLNHMNIGALLQKVAHHDPQAISAQSIIEMATINGANALGMESEIGSLEIGKKADIIMVDIWKPYIQPVHDPIAALVYGVTGSDVDTVIIDGKILMNKYQFTNFDVNTVIEEATTAATKLKKRVESLNLPDNK